MNSIAEVFFIFLKLGLTSFGGPVAHLGYFHEEFVRKREWLDEHAYGDLVALCQFLPGPASSQVGIAIGLLRAGVLGSLAAWIGFTLPSAILLVAFPYGVSIFDGFSSGGWLHGLKIVAVAIVAQAIWGMAVKLCPDRQRTSIALAAAAAVLLVSSSLAQVGVIITGGLIGVFLLKHSAEAPPSSFNVHLSRRGGAFALITFAALLVALPILAIVTANDGLRLFDSFFRAGSLVYGGGHVVLPLLKAEVVDTGWVTSDMFMAGYGAAQAIPGPLFAFSAYLGAVSTLAISGILGAIICLIGAFAPSFLLIVGALPFWESLRRHSKIRSAMLGINASVVGLLLAAFYNPVWTSAILKPEDFALALVCFLALAFWKAPSWSVVIFGAIAGGLWL
ncbi:MAG: chromate efflux transporter [Proteobacteria bacterium]|nr:MAG: chromate efflux transporter [Pseudomonadota bacterium]